MLSEGHGVVHYVSIDFTYEGKQQMEFVGWTEKFDEKIARYYQCHLMIKKANLSDVLCVPKLWLEATM